MKKTNYTDRHGKKRYRLQRTVGKKFNSKTNKWEPKVKSFYGTCKSDAEAKFIAYINDNTNNYNKPQAMCLGEAIDEWLATVFTHSKLAITTKNKYISAYNRLLKNSFIAGQPLNEITAIDLQHFYNSINGSFSSRKSLHNLLLAFYCYAELNGITNNITNSLVVPKPQRVTFNKKIDVWSDDDLKKLISTLTGTPLKLLCILAVNTGARFSELLALKYDDIHDGEMTICKQLYELPSLDGAEEYQHIGPPKSETSNRVIPLADEVLKEIEEHKKLQKNLLKKNNCSNHGYIFTTQFGTLYYKRNINRAIKRHCLKHDIPYHSFHAFRHTFGTNLSRAGVSIETVCKLMGHSSVNVTAQYYIHIDAQRQKDAVEKILSFSLNS